MGYHRLSDDRLDVLDMVEEDQMANDLGILEPQSQP